MEFGTVAGVGAVPFGEAILHYHYHVKAGAAMQQAKMPQPGPSGRGYGLKNCQYESCWVLGAKTSWK